MVKRVLAAACAMLCATVAGSALARSNIPSPTLDAVRAPGQVNCDITTGVAGFALPDTRGEWQRMDVEMCRDLAVAIVNGRSKVRFVPLSSLTRFTALGSGEIDVLFRTSTQTMLRDTTLGLRHVMTYFRDGHGFMVRANAGVTRARDMSGATTCVPQGTTNEQVTADYFRSVNVPFQSVIFERADQAEHAPPAGRHPGA